MNFSFKLPRLFWVKVSDRPPNEDESMLANILKDIASESSGIQIIVQTRVATGDSKFSACVIVCMSGDNTGHWRNELNIAVARKSLAEPQFLYQGNPNMLTLNLPKEYDMSANRNALYLLAVNTLQSWVVGVFREISTYLFFSGGKRFSSGDRWASVTSVRYANPKEDIEEGWDILLRVSTDKGIREVHLQVTGRYQEEKDYGGTGLVRYSNESSDPGEEVVAAFLLNLWEGKEGQEIFFAQK